MRVKGLNGQGGNKDMQLSAQAVIFPASVTVVKVADTERPTCSFEGKVAGNGGDTHTNEVTGTATDNEGNTATGKDKADIDIADVLPSIRVTKTAGLSTVHSGDSVTYTYAVHNLGIEPLSDVAVTDDKCSPVTQTGGDATDDELLDLTEVWTFTCTTELEGTTTNIATGTGKDDEGNTATDTDTATVSVVDPKVVIDKVAALTEISVGDSVTYTYTVTNPGNAPLADVTVTDDKCGPVTLTGGDADNDALLDPGETWVHVHGHAVEPRPDHQHRDRQGQGPDRSRGDSHRYGRRQRPRDRGAAGGR